MLLVPIVYYVYGCVVPSYFLKIFVLYVIEYYSRA